MAVAGQPMNWRMLVEVETERRSSICARCLRRQRTGVHLRPDHQLPERDQHARPEQRGAGSASRRRDVLPNLNPPVAGNAVAAGHSGHASPTSNRRRLAAPTQPAGNDFDYRRAHQQLRRGQRLLPLDRFFRLVDEPRLPARDLLRRHRRSRSQVDHRGFGDRAAIPMRTVSATVAGDGIGSRRFGSPTSATPPTRSGSPPTGGSSCTSWAGTASSTTTSTPPTSASRTARATASPSS